ncbi:MAG TPA: hypothetical protein VJO53_08975 [Candidatus Acidoferrales bacterium]|nr:hypothetical protein [Candidatus Acidoferrales bacterium]
MSLLIGAALTRRAFLGKLAAGAFAGAGSLFFGARAFSKAAAESEPSRAVVSFHMDRPYIDVTGKAMPFLPPRGACSAAPVAHLSERAFRCVNCYA